MRASILFLAVVMSSGLLSSAPTQVDTAEASHSSTFSPEAAREPLPSASCDSLLETYIDTALPAVGPWGLAGFGTTVLASSDAAAVAEERSAAPTTTTNNQVAGVDEADTLKTNGRHIYALVGAGVEVARIGARGIDLIGHLDLPFRPQTLLLHGDALWAIGPDDHRSSVDPGASGLRIAPSPTRVSIVEIDVSTPRDPHLGKTLTVDGRLIGARLVDGVIQMGLVSGPVGFDWHRPEGDGLRAETGALSENRRLVRQSTLDNWLPAYRLTDATGEVEAHGTFTDCSRVFAPEEPSMWSTVSIATFQVDAGIESWDTAGVLGDGSTYYANNEHAYVASRDWHRRWPTPGSDRTPESADVVPSGTDIHQFAVSSRPRHVASGSVPGHLIGQFALDEHDGVLRVASTVDGWEVERSESMVTTLERRGRDLLPLGSVEGLGKGERIYSVRFLGDIGYVVTFRQIDPLYTLDLSDPERPRAAGELKITGYSSYLHPLGDGRLLGVGQEANSNGRPLGMQVSLFDVADSSSPTRLDQVHLPDTLTEVEWEHHAFTMAGGTAFVPVSPADGDPAEAGILVIDIDDRMDIDMLEARDEGDRPGRSSHLRRTLVTETLIIGMGDFGFDVWDRDSHSWIEFEPHVRP